MSFTLHIIERQCRELAANSQETHGQDEYRRILFISSGAVTKTDAQPHILVLAGRPKTPNLERRDERDGGRDVTAIEVSQPAPARSPCSLRRGYRVAPPRQSDRPTGTGAHSGT